MTEVVSVRFRDAGKFYYFDPNGLALNMRQKVIVETTRGMDCGEVVMPNLQIEDTAITQPLRKVVRAATGEDIARAENNRRREKEAFVVCEQKIQAHHLEMKLIDVEFTFDLSKILFYFTADGRVDFRELVRDLAAVFRTRIELRQVGVRDEARILGGLGICGQPFCCSRFLSNFYPVSIKMAKEQGLSLNPVKISGTCGRLMCCLKYEQDAYEYLQRQTPRIGALVQTPEGPATVIDTAILTGMVKVRLERSQDQIPKVFQRDELKLLRNMSEKEKTEKEKNGEPQ